MCLARDCTEALKLPVQGNKVAGRAGHRDELNVLSPMPLEGGHQTRGEHPFYRERKASPHKKHLMLARFHGNRVTTRRALR